MKTTQEALAVLQEVLADLPTIVKNSTWDSLIVNRRKPWTYRAFTKYKDIRICLHRFATCDEHESFLHPHPWSGAFAIIRGSYVMSVGKSPDREQDSVEVAKFILTKGCQYAITDPLTWHSVTPLEECYTVMVNSDPWPAEVAHTKVRTTKGKDLDKMSAEELKSHLNQFLS